MRKLFRSAILGAPGSGKGTLSSKIVKKYDVYHISTGDILRKNIEDRTEIGNAVKEFITSGKLVPDDLITRMVFNLLSDIKNKNWLLDGYPRTVAQAETLFDRYPLHLVIKLRVPYDVIRDRVKDRWIHPGSGRVYNTSYKPPKNPGVDDITGEPLIQRPDDLPEAVAKRLQQFENQTKPLVEYYRDQNILKVFEGNTTDEIWQQVDKTLMHFLKPKS